MERVIILRCIDVEHMKQAKKNREDREDRLKEMRREIKTSGPLKSIHRYNNENLHEWVLFKHNHPDAKKKRRV